jgi:hypothetical protein
MLNVKARIKFIDAKDKGIIDANESTEYIEKCLHDDNQPEVRFISKHGSVSFTQEDIK